MSVEDTATCPEVECTCYRIDATRFCVALNCYFHGQVRRARRRGRLADIQRHMRNRRWVSKIMKGSGKRPGCGGMTGHYTPRISRCIEWAGSMEQEWPYLRFAAVEQQRWQASRQRWIEDVTPETEESE